jgi:RNA polymerase-binding transcription factor DksA
MEESAVRSLLGAERESTLARITAMTTEFEEIVAGSADSNGDDEHDPEGSTVAFERAQIGALVLEARAYLVELDRALGRLDAGSYWVCEQCGAPIAAERLAARPATRTCIRCATALRSTPRPRL